MSPTERSQIEIGRWYVEHMARFDPHVAAWLADVDARLARADADRQRADDFAWRLTAPTGAPVADAQQR